MKIFVRDAEGETGKWRSVLANVSVCLLTSRPKPEPVGMVLGCMKTLNGTTFLKIKTIFGSIYL